MEPTPTATEVIAEALDAQFNWASRSRSADLADVVVAALSEAGWTLVNLPKSDPIPKDRGYEGCIGRFVFGPDELNVWDDGAEAPISDGAGNDYSATDARLIGVAFLAAAAVGAPSPMGHLDTTHA